MKEEKRIWRRFILFACYLLFIPASYLIYGSVVEKFGKKYDEMPKYIFYVDVFYFILSIVSIYLFYRFLGNNWEKIEKKKNKTLSE